MDRRGSGGALLPVLGFHLRVGVRLALAVLVKGTAVAVGVAAFLKLDFLADLARSLFGAQAGWASALLVLAAAASVAAVAAPRVGAGLGGWLRHLPVTGASHRRAAAAAVAVAETPVLALLALLVIAAGWGPGSGAAQRLAGLPVVALAAALAALPVGRRAVVMGLALASGTLAGSGSWLGLGAAVALLAAADLAAGAPRPARAGGARRRAAGLAPAASGGVRSMPRGLARTAAAAPRTGLQRRARGGSARSWLPVRVAARAVGWRMVRAYLAALLPWAAAALFIHNNQLAAVHAVRAAILGGAGASAVLLAALAQTLAVRRPAWPWSRSLPWAAKRRVLDDAAALGLACLPLVALAGLLAPAAALPLAAVVPLLAVRAAGAMRRPPASASGPAAAVFIEGLLLAGLTALLPWAAVALLAAVPAALRAAAERERRQKISLWLERLHLAAGDPQSWSAG